MIEYRKRVNTLRQEAADRGLNFDLMSDEEQLEFELSVLKTMKNITTDDIAAFNEGMIDYTSTNFRGGRVYSNGAVLLPTSQKVKTRGFVQKHSILADYQKQDPDLTLEQLQYEYMALHGKTTSGYIHEVCIPIFDNEDDTHDWEIQITRKSKELTADEKKFSGKEIVIESIALVTEQELSLIHI
mgnify:FL=1